MSADEKRLSLACREDRHLGCDGSHEFVDADGDDILCDCTCHDDPHRVR